MTQDEFIKRYHDYSTQSEEAAMAEAIMVDAEGIVGNRAIAVKFGDLGWCAWVQSLESPLFRGVDSHLCSKIWRVPNETHQRMVGAINQSRTL